MKMFGGWVGGDGQVRGGTGDFSVSKEGTGEYMIFNGAGDPALPIAVVTPFAPPTATAVISNRASCAFWVQMSNTEQGVTTPHDWDFYFIAFFP